MRRLLFAAVLALLALFGCGGQSRSTIRLWHAYRDDEL